MNHTHIIHHNPTYQCISYIYCSLSGWSRWTAGLIMPEDSKNPHGLSPSIWLFPDVDKMPGKVGWSTGVRWNLCQRWLEVLRQENLEYWLFGVHTSTCCFSLSDSFRSFLLALLQSFCWATERWRDSSIGPHSQRREGTVYGTSKFVMRFSDQKSLGQRCNSLTSHVTILGGTSFKWKQSEI